METDRGSGSEGIRGQNSWIWAVAEGYCQEHLVSHSSAAREQMTALRSSAYTRTPTLSGPTPGAWHTSQTSYGTPRPVTAACRICRLVLQHASAVTVARPLVRRRNAASAAQLRTRGATRSGSAGSVCLPSGVPCPPRAHEDGEQRSTAVQYDPHDHPRDQVSALVRDMSPPKRRRFPS